MHSLKVPTQGMNFMPFPAIMHTDLLYVTLGVLRTNLSLIALFIAFGKLLFQFSLSSLLWPCGWISSSFGVP